MLGYRRARGLCAVASALVILSACADETAKGTSPPDQASVRPQGGATAESECRALQGSIVSGSDRAVTVRAAGRQVSAILPGEAWCEVPVPPASNIRQFVHMPPRLEQRRVAPNASAFDMHFVMIELALLPPAGGGTYPPVEAVRAGYANALRPGQGPISGPGSGLTGLIRRGARAEVGAIDPATGCFPVSMDGDMLAPNQTPRRFEMRSRVCVTQVGTGAAATLQLLQEWTPGAPDAPERVQAYHGSAERLFASMRLGGAP